jgi:hypothetical protein
MRRIVALLAAAALVVIAIVVRNQIDSGGSTGGGTGQLRLICSPDLDSVCRSLGRDLDISLEEPGATTDSFAKAGLTRVDGWLTLEPWPDIVEAARQQAGLPPAMSIRHALGRSPIGLAVWPERLAVLRRSCPAPITWHCIGDVAGKVQWTAVGGDPGWGLIKVGVPDPMNDATGLAAVAAATAGYFGRTDVSSLDLQDDTYRSWLRGFARASKNVPFLDTALAAGPSLGDGITTIGAVGAAVLRSSARPDKPVLLYPAPVASADVVLGSAKTDRGRRLARLVDDRLAAALRTAGWQPPTNQASGLPSAALVDALRSAWKDAGG